MAICTRNDVLNSNFPPASLSTSHFLAQITNYVTKIVLAVTQVRVHKTLKKSLPTKEWNISLRKQNNSQLKTNDGKMRPIMHLSICRN